MTSDINKYSWRVRYRKKGCLKYEQRIYEGNKRLLLKGLEKNTVYEFNVLCMTDSKVFAKYPKEVNTEDYEYLYVGFKGISCVIGPI